MGSHHAHSSHDGHVHAIGPDADRRYLIFALVLLVVFMLAEVIAAFIGGSLALLSDAGHMSTDAAALGIALWAVRLGARPATDRWTYGLKRAEIVSAAVNAITLVVVSGILLVEVVRRLVADETEVAGPLVIVVAGIGIVVNSAVAWLVSKANRSSLNVEGAYQHVLTDLYAFIATFVAGVVIVTTGWAKADLVASLIGIALMLRSAWGLLKDSGHILLQGTPGTVDLEAVRAHLLELDHVVAVHDLHAWSITSDLPTLSAHLVLDESCFKDGHAPQILDQVQGCLADHFDVEHSTFQFEPAGHLDHETSAH